MSNETRMPPDVNAEAPATAPAPETQGVLSVNDQGVVSPSKRGKAGPRAQKGRTAAQRKPEKKAPAARKAAKKVGAGGRFKPTAEASRWKSPAKRTAGSKPTAAQKKTPKKAPARKAAPARKQARAKRATAR